ncbi:MAG: hypothetical protein L3J23_04990 [Flavobacteriaceae bacterium]|nr:hypothetical protein [Flavobacteriaceae bacterium]
MTENIDAGETLTIEIEEKEGQEFNKGEKKLTYTSTVKANGSSTLDIEINKDWQEATNRTLVLKRIHTAEMTFEVHEELKIVDPNEKKVLDVYLAEKKIKYVDEEDGEYTYTFKNDKKAVNNHEKNVLSSEIFSVVKKTLESLNQKPATEFITEALKTNKEAGKIKESYKKGETLTFKVYKLERKKEEHYQKMSSVIGASMGNQIYIIAKTKNLEGKKVKIKLHEKEDELKLLKDKDAILPVLVYAKKEDKTTDTQASDWIEIDIKKEKGKKETDNVILSQGEEEIEVGIKKIQLRPKTDKMASKDEEASKSFEGWAEKLYIREDETEAGKKAKKAKEEEKTITLNFDKDAIKESFPEKITWLKSSEIGKEEIYTITKYLKGETEVDKNNIRWSLYIQSKKKNYTIIDTKTKTDLYTYAKTELIDGKNQLTIIFDKALKGKKVQIEPFREEAPKLNTKNDYVSTTLIKEKATPKITKLDTTKLWLQTECDDCKEKEKKKEFLKENYFKLKTPDTIHIYSDGKISKTPLTLLKNIRYVYVASDGEEHDLGKYNLIEAQKWNYGSSRYHSGWKKIVTIDNKGNEKEKYFEYAKGKVKLVKFKLPLSYNYNNVNIKLKDNSTREYINPEAFACLIGALAEVGYDDITLNGFTSKDGTGAPSVTHFNGIAGDFRYLRKDKKIASLHINTSPNQLDVERQEKFIDALVKFGWKNFYSYDTKIDKKDFILKKSTHLANHHHHLHLRYEQFKPNYK